MDQTEVTQGQYKAFLDAKNGDTSGQMGVCESNQYNISLAGSDFQGCPPEFWTPEKTPSRAVVCVDSCDAVAYCQWAGKHLCGRVGGGPVPTDPKGDTGEGTWEPGLHNDPEASQLYNACSQGGTLPYAYGTSKEEERCEEGPVVQDVSVSSCRGQAPPFDQLIYLSGGIAEWEWIEPFQTENGGVTRGGAFFSPEKSERNERCDAPRFTSTGAEVGFRCCYDF